MAAKKQEEFLPASSAGPAIDAQALTVRLAQLNRDVQAADRERATAEAQLAQARKDLAEIDAQLKGMSVDPDQAETMLAALEQQLAAQTADFEQQVAKERVAYQAITAALA